MNIDIIRELHSLFANDILIDTDSLEFQMYVGQLEHALIDKGFDLERIYKTNDGRFKTKKPFQVSRKSRKEVLEKLFEYYYPNGLNLMTFEEVYELQKKDIAKNVADGVLSYQTLQDFTNYFNKYVKKSALSKKSIKDIKASHLDAFFKQILKENPMTKSSFSHLKTIFNQTFDKAILLDLVEYNVSLNLNTSKYKFKEKKKVIPYTQEERQCILNALDLDKPLHLMIGLMFCLNIRVSELEALKWENVNFTNKTIYIGAEMQRKKDVNGNTYYERVEHTKSNKIDGNRWQLLSDRAIGYLNLERKKHPFGYIFVREDGEPFRTNDVNHELKRKICPIANVEYKSTHKNRYRVITTQYAMGVDEEVIRQNSGHTSANMTKKYNQNHNNLLLDYATNEIING